MTNTNRREEIESQISNLAESLDGADIFAVLYLIADSQSEFIEDFLSSRLALDIIDTTQSNPDQAKELIMTMAMLDQELSELD